MAHETGHDAGLLIFPYSHRCFCVRVQHAPKSRSSRSAGEKSRSLTWSVFANRHDVQFNQNLVLLQTAYVLDTWIMRWRPGPVRKRHVPEPERLRQQAAN